LTTLAGRSTTSPAAMRLTMVSESWRTGMNGAPKFRRVFIPQLRDSLQSMSGFT
jgi:hypothetical protein